MLGLQVFVQVDRIELTLTPQNILNEMDGVTSPFGITRYQGEKSKYYKDSAHRIAALAFESPEEQQRLLGLELRVDSEFAVFEQSDLTEALNKIEVLDSYKLQISTFEPGLGTNLFTSSTSTYDLLNRKTYPFLEEVLAHVTQNVVGVRAFISPLGHGRYNHLLPYHLVPYQRNYEYSSGAFLNSTSFYLPDKYLVPDSVELTQGNIPDNIYNDINFVNNPSLVLDSKDIYINYWTGYVQSGSDFSKYSPAFTYQTILPSYRFQLTPSSTIFSYASTDIATRLNALDDPNGEVLYNRYQVNSSIVDNGYLYCGSKVSPNLAFMIDEGNLIDTNLNRWA